MKLLRRNQALKKPNSSSCTVAEYSIDNDLFNVATAKISGRYPQERQVTNLECCELAYVLQGQGRVVINHKVYRLAAGDVVIIEAKEKYYWEGSMELFIVNRHGFLNNIK